jgi:hypothetical protein
MRLTDEVLEGWPWHGTVRIRVARHVPNCLWVRGLLNGCTCMHQLIEDRTIDNLITTVGKNMARDMLLGLVADAKVRWFGVGTSSTAPAVGQTTLVAEVFRKITTTSSQGAAGEAVNTVFIAPNEAVVNIQELGFFAGAAASGTANTGIMVARVLYSHVKTALESIQVDRRDQF